MSGCTSKTSTTSFTLGQIVRQFGARYTERYQPNKRVIKVLNDIGNCRTASLGGHYVECIDCGYSKKVYNSCGNSNCCQCQNLKKELWIDKMMHHLLPVQHFHVIFTVPHQLNDLFFYNQRKMYALFFSSAWETINELTGEGDSGMVCTLHTWGSNLSYHPHLHCIIPKGTFKDEKWESKNAQSAHFFVKVEKLRNRFKEIFLSKLIRLIDHDLLYIDGLTINLYTIEKIRSIYGKVQKIKKWSVRIEVPICGYKQIVEYLGRYIKRVAITNSRILDVTNTKVSFCYNKYAEQEQGKAAPKGVRTMDGEKFMQQFTQHILPLYFHRVRYYGIYAYTNKKKKQIAYESITNQTAPTYQAPLKRHLIEKMLGSDPDVCPGCGCYNTLISNPIEDELISRFRLKVLWVNPSVKLRQLGKNIAL